MPDRAALLQGAAVVAAAGLFVWVLAERPARETEAATAMHRHVEVAPERDFMTAGVVPERSELVEVEPTPKSAAELFLEEYYGAEADAIRAELVAAGVDLASYPSPIPEAEIRAVLPQWFTFKPFELEGRAKEMVAWPDPLTVEWVQDRFALQRAPDESVVAMLDSLALSYNQDIRYAIEDFMRATERGLQFELMRNNVQLEPFVTRPWPTQPGTFMATKRAGSGWTAGIVLLEADHPEVLEARKYVYDLIENRDATLRDALFGL